MRSLAHLLLTAGLALALAWTAGRAAAADAQPVFPFNGTDLTGWKTQGDPARSHWVVGRASLEPDNPAKLCVKVIPPQADGGPAPRELINREGGGVNLYSEKTFGDCTLEVEFMVPKGSNSGIYVMGEYEVQVFDSYGRDKVGQGDLGALYSAAAPRKNAARKPGEWQKFVIDFQAPRFEGGKKVANAVFKKVVLNGEVIHENVSMKGATPGGLTGKEAPQGPIMFQGDHGPVAYRALKVTPRGR